MYRFKRGRVCYVAGTTEGSHEKEVLLDLGSGDCGEGQRTWKIE